MCGMDASSAPKIGRTIKRARERKRMSQAEAAAQLGVSRSALNAWENDRAYPRSSIGAIEELYGIVIDEPEPPTPDLPTPAEMERLREHIRQVLGDDRAAVVEDAIDRAVEGRPRARRRGDAEGGRSERRPAS